MNRLNKFEKKYKEIFEEDSRILMRNLKIPKQLIILLKIKILLK